jgi:hypothetical protein
MYGAISFGFISGLEAQSERTRLLEKLYYEALR